MKALRTIALSLLALLALTACAAPDISAWSVKAQIPIVAIDDTQGIWVAGGRHWVDGGSYVDYQYAYAAQDGSIKQGMVSELYEKYSYLTRSGHMPSQAVSIYQDVKPDYNKSDPDQGPRIVVLQCELTEQRSGFDNAECTDPSTGNHVDSSSARVEIHVPVGAIVDLDALSPEEDPNDRP